jgi:Uma2 family endonuclease
MNGALTLPGTEPIPDVMILRRADEVRGKLPTPVACSLVIEVSDSTIAYDRSGKREVYARGGIPEYWVIDVNKRRVVLHLQPVAGDYQHVSEHARGSTFASPALGGRRISVDEVLR